MGRQSTKMAALCLVLAIFAGIPLFVSGIVCISASDWCPCDNISGCEKNPETSGILRVVFGSLFLLIGCITGCFYMLK